MHILIDRVVNLPIDDSLTFDQNIANIAIDKPIELPQILFKKGQRCIGYTEPSDLPFELQHDIDSVECYADKKIFAQFGVYLLALLLGSRRYIEFNITHPQSDIKQLFFYLVNEQKVEHSGLEVASVETYSAFEYFSQIVDKFAFANFPGNTRQVSDKHLPNLFLNCSKRQFNDNKARIDRADQLIVALSVTGLVQLAELFLDMANKHNLQDEVCLENPLYGFGGTDQRSIEIRFWLPGSFAWFEETDIYKLTF